MNQHSLVWIYITYKYMTSSETITTSIPPFDRWTDPREAARPETPFGTGLPEP